LAKGTGYEAPRYAVFFDVPLLYPSSVQRGTAANPRWALSHYCNLQQISVDSCFSSLITVISFFGIFFCHSQEYPARLKGWLQHSLWAERFSRLKPVCLHREICDFWQLCRYAYQLKKALPVSECGTIRGLQAVCVSCPHSHRAYLPVDILLTYTRDLCIGGYRWAVQPGAVICGDLREMRPWTNSIRSMIQVTHVWRNYLTFGL
jgi:hypothetical protein